MYRPKHQINTHVLTENKWSGKREEIRMLLATSTLNSSISTALSNQHNKLVELGLVGHAFNSSTREAEVKDLWV